MTAAKQKTVKESCRMAGLPVGRGFRSNGPIGTNRSTRSIHDIVCNGECTQVDPAEIQTGCLASGNATVPCRVQEMTS